MTLIRAGADSRLGLKACGDSSIKLVSAVG